MSHAHHDHTHAQAAPETPKDATAATRRANEAMLSKLPFGDRRDFDDARRGFIADVPRKLAAPNGRALYDLDEYAFLAEERAPATVNPSLWRQARLNMITGLFRVAERVYQIRGADIANMTVIEGERGLIVIDPLTVNEAARAALDLYYAHRPRKPVVAVIYSHSHVDHFGGVKGIASDEDAASGRVAIIAPDGFMAAVGGENIMAGIPMTRRAQFQFGPLLKKGPRGQVDAGLGKGITRGSVSLIPPTVSIVKAFETHVIDGVEIVFQLAPESEAPAEMHMFLPQFGILNMAENATKNLHNFCPIRGAVVRDPRVWSKYLAVAAREFGPKSDVLIGQHHWPTWGKDEIAGFLAKQRDLYKHIHDQSLRLANKGFVPAEIAEVLDLPPELQNEWAARGYYGTVSHNSKAVYQRYLSWYDGNPSNLNPHTPRETAKRVIRYVGGTDAAIAKAREDFAQGDYRWVAQIMSHAVFAEPEHRGAKSLLADALEQLGYQAESATWRNAYLYGAQELREGLIGGAAGHAVARDLVKAMTTDLFFDLMGVRLDAKKVAGKRARINWHFTDTDERVLLNLENSTLTHLMGASEEKADASVTLARATLNKIIGKETTMPEAVQSGAIKIAGDARKLVEIFGALDEFKPMFEILTPGPDRP
jgi:alkyl sulfatase BDS1-like metallo-beta-lactamase superfamily hydrolase